MLSYLQSRLKNYLYNYISYTVDYQRDNRNSYIPVEPPVKLSCVEVKYFNIW